MTGFNPFAKQSEGPAPEPTPSPKLSFFERLPAGYRKLCEDIGKKANRSPQNKQVRRMADRFWVSQGHRIEGNRPVE